jgi:hypothetical protein
MENINLDRTALLLVYLPQFFVLLFCAFMIVKAWHSFGVLARGLLLLVILLALRRIDDVFDVFDSFQTAVLSWAVIVVVAWDIYHVWRRRQWFEFWQQKLKARERELERSKMTNEVETGMLWEMQSNREQENKR